MDSTRQQIVRLLSVLGAGVLGAFALAAFFVYYYGPSGQYQLRNALLAPDLFLQLHYNAPSRITGGDSRFVFNEVSFNWWDDKSKQMRKVVLPEATYREFYQAIAKDESVLNVPVAVQDLFTKTKPASLLLTVRTESNAAWQAEIVNFQEVQLLPGSPWYRVSLHEDKTGNQWVYFKHPGVAEMAFNLFAQ